MLSIIVKNTVCVCVNLLVFIEIQDQQLRYYLYKSKIPNVLAVFDNLQRFDFKLSLKSSNELAVAVFCSIRFQKITMEF